MQILGPLLFLIYINDVCNISEKLQFILYADDTSVFMSDANINKLMVNFNNELCKLSRWLVVNRLILNVKKTQCMIFTNKKINYDNIIIEMNGTKINVATSINFLGVIVDYKLLWH